MMFSEVIGQDGVKAFLLQATQQNRLSHALLFAAPEGAGGLPMALAFSRYVVCTQKEAGGACGRCEACHKAAALMHADIHFSYPIFPRKSGEKPVCTDFLAEWREFVGQYPYGSTFDWLQFIGAENKQGNIPTAECHDILRKLSLKSYESDYKILIMWRPEYLGKDGNRLLKLIEEPPDKTLIVLVAEQPEQLLSTIRSRAQLVRLAPLSEQDIADALRDRAGATPEQARQIALLAEGNYREALQLLQHPADDLLGLLRQWLNALITRRGELLQKWIDEVTAAPMGREKQKQFLKYFINLLEHSVRLRYLGADRLPLPEKELDFALRFQRLADDHQIEAIIRELDQACFHIERNAHGKILFHALSIRLQHIFSTPRAA